MLFWSCLIQLLLTVAILLLFLLLLFTLYIYLHFANPYVRHDTHLSRKHNHQPYSFFSVYKYTSKKLSVNTALLKQGYDTIFTLHAILVLQLLQVVDSIRN